MAPLRANPNRWDWFELDRALGVQLGVGLVPGVQLAPHGRFWHVHRTHLPLLGDLGVKLLAQRNRPIFTHEERALRAGDLKPPIALRPHQQTGLDFIEPRRGVLLADEMRLGKATPLGARVLTPRGWRTMGSLRLGDRVVDPDGGEGEVTGIFPQGVRSIYRLTTCDGASTECDLEHLWLVYTRNDRFRKSAGRVLTLRQFKDDLKTISGRGGRKYYLPLCAPVVFDSPGALPIAPYVLGALIGDGSLSNAEIQITVGDAEILGAVAAQLPPELELRFRSKMTWGVVPRKARGPNHLRAALREMKLNCKSPCKFIPQGYLHASVRERLELLRGLMDTDGDVSLGQKGGCIVSYNTTSDQLVEDVRELVGSLGGFASVGKHTTSYVYRGQKRAGLLSYRLHIRIGFNPFLLPRKAQRWRLGNMARGIKSVEYVGEKPVQCIEVSTKRNLYVTDGYIVTHNTLTALLAHDPARGPLLVIAPLSTRKVWLGWMKRLWPDIDPVVIVGETSDPDKLRGAKIIFGHYGILTHHKITSLKPGTFVVDEAHLISNEKSKRTEAIHFYATVAQRTILLTGTPLQNTSRGLWALLATCNPGAWGRSFPFLQRYCAPVMGEYGWKYTGVSNEIEWALRRSEMHLARTWNQVSPGLPPIQRTIEMIDLDAKALLAIDRLAYELRKNATALTIEDQNYYRQATGLFKVDLAVDLALRSTATPQPVVMWIWHRKVAAAIAKKLTVKKVPCFVVTGDDNLKARDLLMDAWRETTNGALIISIDVGQVGIDLSHAHHAIFVEIDWVPLRISQAEMRTFAPERPMSADYLVLNHELDLALVAALQAKIDTGNAAGMAAAGSMFRAPSRDDEIVDDASLIAAFQAAVQRVVA